MTDLRMATSQKTIVPVAFILIAPNFDKTEKDCLLVFLPLLQSETIQLCRVFLFLQMFLKSP